jgi:hypothetical protein
MFTKSSCVHPAVLLTNFIIIIIVSVFHSIYVQLIVLLYLHSYGYGYMFRQKAIFRPV